MPQHEPEVSRTRELELPRHPDGWECRHCKCYLKEREYKAFILPDGTAVPESVARSQIPLGVLAQCKTTTESFCTLNPRWERVSVVHWCWQFPDNHR